MTAGKQLTDYGEIARAREESGILPFCTSISCPSDVILVASERHSAPREERGATGTAPPRAPLPEEAQIHVVQVPSKLRDTARGRGRRREATGVSRAANVHDVEKKS